MVTSWLDAVSQLTEPLANANWQFKQVKQVSLPLLVAWSGYLAATQPTRHFIACTKLTGYTDEKFTFLKPDKFARETTHDIISCYQKAPYRLSPTQLFRFQIHGNDAIAIEISQTLANAMINCNPQYSRYLLDIRYEHIWQDVAEIKLKTLDTQYQRIWRIGKNRSR